MISFTDSVIIILYIHCKIIKEILKSSKNLLIRTFTISTKKKFTFEKEIKLISIEILILFLFHLTLIHPFVHYLFYIKLPIFYRILFFIIIITLTICADTRIGTIKKSRKQKSYFLIFKAFLIISIFTINTIDNEYLIFGSK